MKHAAVADDLGRAAQPYGAGTVAVEEPAAGVAGKALEMVGRIVTSAKVAGGLGVGDDRQQRLAVFLGRPP
jgi:hypothetical protein